MKLIGRTLRIIALGITTLLGTLSAVSVVTYARYGRIFRQTVGAAASFTAVFYGIAYLVWRLCGGKRQRDLDRGHALES